MAFLSLPLCAQTPPSPPQPLPPLNDTYNDIVQSRFGASIALPMPAKWELSLGTEVRTTLGFGDIDKILTSAVVNYSPWKMLTFESEYNFVNWHTAGRWRIKHRLNLGIIGRLTLGRFALSLRERVKFNIKHYKTDPYNLANPLVMMRTRLMATYRNKSAWQPYAFAEFYGMMNAPTAVENNLTCGIERKPYFNRLRLCGGANVSISPKSVINIYYLFIFNRAYYFGYDSVTGDLLARQRKNSRVHAIGINYKFKL